MSAPSQSMSRLVPFVVSPNAGENDTALGRLDRGEMLVELCNDNTNGRAGALEALLCSLEQGTVLRWISNPLRSPLTLERLFLQAVGPEADLRVERSAAELARLLQQAAGAARRCLLIVQQPETLDAEARDTLARMVPYLADGPAVVQFLFCCTSAFRPIEPVPVGRSLPVLSLNADALAPARRQLARSLLLMLLLLAIASVAGILFLMRRAPPDASPAKPIETSSAGAAAVPTLHGPAPSVPAASLALPAFAATASAAPTSATPALAATAPHASTEPATATAPVTAAAMGTSALGAPPSGSPTLGAPALVHPAGTARDAPSSRIDVARVRRAFDTFLAQQPPRVANLNQEQRDALFEEFLRHYQHDDKRAP